VIGSIDHPVKLITGVLYSTEKSLTWVREELYNIWGEEELISKPWIFDMTDYYKSISPSLFRCFISYKGLRSAADIVDWKISACQIECESGSSRTVNIDPGYIDGARLALASTKDHAHRVYIRNGIHVEITLRYQNKKWKPFDCTFPDFASGLYDDFLTEVRNTWLADVKTTSAENV
jgi:hypothetical protein